MPLECFRVVFLRVTLLGSSASTEASSTGPFNASRQLDNSRKGQKVVVLELQPNERIGTLSLLQGANAL